MNRASVGALGLCLCLTGCGGADRERENAGDAAGEKTAEVRPTVVTETGCLTARGDQFVLTDLQRGEGQPTTEAFELIGNGEQLRQHVGKQVRVNGEAQAPKVAVVQESSPAPAEPAPQGTAGAASAKPDAKVDTQTQTRVEVRKLTVSSVEPTGASCAAEATSGGGASPRRQ